MKPFLRKLKRTILYLFQVPSIIKGNIIGILKHPLSQSRPLYFLLRHFCLRFLRLITLGHYRIPILNRVRIRQPLAKKEMSLTVPYGLHEPSDMLFLLKFLRKHDRFLDIGANIGTYSIPLTAELNIEAMAIEAIPSTFKVLKSNIEHNHLGDHLKAINLGVSDKEENIRFSSDLNVSNKVETNRNRSISYVTVQTKSVDQLCAHFIPTAIKIDVEGFETKVINGANETLKKNGLEVIIIELNGHGEKYYGFDENLIHETICNHNFKPVTYDLSKNCISEASSRSLEGNTIYVRNIENTQKRLRSSQFNLSL